MTSARATAARRPSAFTFVELLAVLVITGILATAAALTLRRTAPRETAPQFQERIVHWSDEARFLAAQERRAWALELHPGAKQWTAHPDGSPQPVHDCQLPQGWDLISIRGETVQWSGSPLLIPLDLHGHSATIGLELRDPKGDYRFLILTGLCGQSTWFDRKEAADACFTDKN